MIRRNTLERLMTLTEAGEIRRLLVIDAQLDPASNAVDNSGLAIANVALDYLCEYVALRHAGEEPDRLGRFHGFSDTELRSIEFALQAGRSIRFEQMNEAERAARKGGSEDDATILRALYPVAVRLHEEAATTLANQLGLAVQPTEKEPQNDEEPPTDADPTVLVPTIFNRNQAD